MNFLAHIYLSGNDDLVKIGNFMADGIRGQQYVHLDAKIKKGILLHRAIDSFTDSHPIFRNSTKRLHENYHHYSGVIVDMFYDHFLAKNWTLYSEERLEDFAGRFYNSLAENYNLLTDKTKHMMPYMIENDWLSNYQHLDGIAQILTQMDRRTKNNSRMAFSIAELKQFYPEFESEFTQFFDEVIAFANRKSIEL